MTSVSCYIYTYRASLPLPNPIASKTPDGNTPGGEEGLLDQRECAGGSAETQSHVIKNL